MSLLRLIQGFKDSKRIQWKLYWSYVAMELVNGVLVIAHFYVGGKVMGKHYTLYGYHFLQYSMGYDDRDVSSLLFPIQAACQYNSHGVGGGIENRNPLCTLPLNDIFGKVFLMLWFTVAFLFVIDCYVYLQTIVIVFFCQPLSFIYDKIGKLKVKKIFPRSYEKFFLGMIRRNIDESLYIDFKMDLRKQE